MKEIESVNLKVFVFKLKLVNRTVVSLLKRYHKRCCTAEPFMFLFIHVVLVVNAEDLYFCFLAFCLQPLCTLL